MASHRYDKLYFEHISIQRPHSYIRIYSYILYSSEIDLKYEYVLTYIYYYHLTFTGRVIFLISCTVQSNMIRSFARNRQEISMRENIACIEYKYIGIN